jgi:hypothetical protein
MGDQMPRRYRFKRRRREDPERAQDMADVVKKLRAKKKRMRKHAHEGEVANIFKGQNFSDEDVKMGPRNTGWKVIARKITKRDNGQIIEKTTRIRTFGRLKKTAFIHGFLDELDKLGAIAKMLIEPRPKKSTALEKNPFLRLESKRKLVSGQGRTKDFPKSKKLMSGSAQYAHLTRPQQREAS